MSHQFEKLPSPKTGCVSRVAQCLLATLVLTLPLTAAVSQRQKITSAPRGVGAQFGNAVALSGNTMVVGARFDSTTASQAGAAFVYVFDGTTWTQQARLLADDGAAIDKFGYSVAISGDTIVVGAYNDDSPASNAGSAYVFVRSGTTWTQQQKLALGAVADQEFGNAVAIAGDVIAVGEHFSDLPSNAEAGAVYIYRRTGTTWTSPQKLIPVGGVILGDHFGESLAISGATLVVGADGTDIPETAAGSVYVFAESGGVFVQEDKLSIPDGGNGDNFGFSVAIEGTTLVGGALFYTPLVGQISHGAAYVFEFNGASWSPQGRLIPSDGAVGDNFGWSVAVSDNTVVVGARGDDTTAGADAGSAYLFTRSGATWTQQEKLTPDDAINGDRFGAGVALSFGKLVIGASEKALTGPNGQGAAYVFQSSTRPVFPDFDGDRQADLSFFRPGGGSWNYVKSSDGSFLATLFGTATDLMAPADFDGDRKTDIGVFRPEGGNWYLQRSTGGLLIQQFGATGDLPMPADYDGDGLADIAIFRPSTGEWFRTNSSTSTVVSVQFGLSGDIPLLGDFDGDGKNDISVFRPSTSSWLILRSSDSTTTSTQWGLSADTPAPADYDGDGKTDLAVFRPSTGTWYILRSSDSTLFTAQWGLSSDTPAPADFDGDGRADLAVFRASTGTWYALLSSTSTARISQFGMLDDLPVPLFFIRPTLPAPTITTQPLSQSAVTGTSATFTVAATGTTTLSYQWQRRAAGASTWTDVAIGGAYAGATSASLTVTTTATMGGDQFQVIITSLNGTSVTSSAVTLTVTFQPRLLNLSTRGLSQSGANVLIPGFVIQGTANKRLLIRAVGPTLKDAPINFPGTVIPDPRMTLKRFNAAIPPGGAYEDVDTNDDWATNANAAAITSTAAQLFAFTLTQAKDAALLVELAAGQYTLVADDATGATGIAIVELYDADSAAVDARLINISNRGFAGIGDQVMIPGFVVSPEGPKTLLVRVVGPTLAAAPYNVPGTMTDPKLELHRTETNGSDTLVLTQDNWSADPNAATTAQVAQQVFAFALTAGSNDAAIVVTLQPGTYTVIGSSAVAGGTGVVLVEVYVVP